MLWYVNVILGFLLGSFAATYSERYRDIFKGLLNLLAKKKKPETNSKKKVKSKK